MKVTQIDVAVQHGCIRVWGRKAVRGPTGCAVRARCPNAQHRGSFGPDGPEQK